jgi:hypothetical protein
MSELRKNEKHLVVQNEGFLSGEYSRYLTVMNDLLKTLMCFQSFLGRSVI